MALSYNVLQGQIFALRDLNINLDPNSMKAKLYLLQGENYRLMGQIKTLKETQPLEDIKETKKLLNEMGTQLTKKQEEWDLALQEIKRRLGEAQSYAKVAAGPVQPPPVLNKYNESVLLIKPKMADRNNMEDKEKILDFLKREDPSIRVRGVNPIFGGGGLRSLRPTQRSPYTSKRNFRETPT
ncbi:hypothetical protein HNY73_003398 [Argiope bruennichi]|uniref:Uncharacterized protein n=1 Tax=Argiope bruennichi TaxID=94029 RepID=A0A8T0FMV7_ARGBR|nr:hypothetical protein HNY73_003398 [Argiope bruennichi]